ncbi:response regulator [Variovorax sp. J31P207]|uniref:response regulator transcription factor n=1 Tax=Variovorax sp. J31P207 TaxID=3053510 RepID=UPI0025749D8F|nr:response regulator [Variovorax sp. J31P207]MDM0072478.1 response regulator [Variovorax sp. J31P207]
MKPAVATVFVVDDDHAVRDSIRELVESVGLDAETFSSAEEYLATHDSARPGCLVVDIRMARVSGLGLQSRLNEMKARIPIVFITAHADVPMVVEAMRGGAVGFVTKPYREQELLDNINEALSRDAAARLDSDRQGHYEQMMVGLTGRESEIMQLAMEGLSSKVIAQRLDISHRTVELHRSRVLEKLGLSSTAELMRIAAEHPLLRSKAPPPTWNQ